MSLLLRRIHLYLALFLAPWVLMYTASTFVMNHRSWFHPTEPPPPPRFELERELTARIAKGNTADWVKQLTAAGIGAHRVVGSLQELMTDPLTVSRGLAVTRDHEGFGPITTTSPGLVFASTTTLRHAVRPAQASVPASALLMPDCAKAPGSPTSGTPPKPPDAAPSAPAPRVVCC
mgnify:CR=1 FL=1